MSQTKAQLLDPVDLSIVTADLADDAVTTDKLASNAVVNASVDASAAIQGTKISPDFGSQVITTTGNASVGETLTITGNDPNVTFVDSNNNPDYKIFANAGTLNFFDSTNNQSRLLINTDGHIDLVGNVDALNGLDVTGTTTSNYLTLSAVNPNITFTDTNDNPDYKLESNSGQFKIIDSTNSADRLIVQTDGTIDVEGNLDANGGIDVTGNIVGTADLTVNTDTLKVDSSNGRVGIGNASPSTILHIKTSNPDVFLENTGTGTGQLRLGHFTNGAFIGTYSDDGGGSDALRLGTHSGDERMRITSDGNIGIGTTSPARPLHVDGSVRIQADSVIEWGGTSTSISGSSGANSLFFRTGDAERMRLNNTGLGIGTTSPQRNLHIQNAVGDALVRITSADGSAAYLEFGDASDGDAGKIVYDNGDNLTFSTANSGTTTEKVRIQGNGIVGIGTTAPEGKGLDVTATRTNGYAETSDTRNLAHLILRNGSDGVGRFAALSFINGGGTQAEGSINLVQTGDYNGDLAFKLRTAVSTWAERMRIKSDGRVFIGSSNPAAAANADDLCIGDNDGSAESGITLGSNTASGIRFADGANNSAGVLEYQHNNDRFAFAPGGNVHLKIDSDGIKFNADTAAANALDDYEEGTAFASTGNATVNQAVYTKVGKMVTISFRISVSAGNTQVMTLPFVHSGNHGDHVLGVVVTAGTFKELILTSSSTITLTAGFSKGTLTYPTNT